jgi:hypothetical protein
MLDAKYRVRVNRDPILAGDRGQARRKKMLMYGLIGGGVLVVILILLIVLGGRGGQEEPPVSETPAAAELTLVTERGDVQVKAADASDFSDAEDGMVLTQGATIRTEEEALVSLVHSGGSVMRLNESSRVEIEKVEATAFTARLVGGESWVSIMGTPAVPATLSTLEVRVEAQGSAYNVTHGKDQSTIMSIDDTAIVTALKLGDDGATTDLGKLLLEEGKQTTVKASDLPENEDDYKSNALSKEFTDSFWYRWNKEKDEEFAASLSGEEDKNEPKLEIAQPKDGATIDDETVEVKGTTDISATVEINDEEVENNLGSFSHTVDLEEGENTIRITATDSAGNVAEKTIKVKRAPAKPNAVTLTLDASEALNIKVSWTKSEADDFSKYILKRNGQALKTFSDVGTLSFKDAGLTAGTAYRYEICVADQDGQETCSGEKSATVKGEPNKPPTVSISAPADGSSMTGGTVVSFGAAGQDPDNETLTYTWDFGDGVSTTGQNATHTYAVVAAPTPYTVTVTVTDRAGATAKATITITIVP